MARRAQKSPGLSLPELRRKVGDGEIAAAYLLCGDEAALRRRALECIRSVFDEESGLPGIVVRLEGGKACPERGEPPYRPALDRHAALRAGE